MSRSGGGGSSSSFKISRGDIKIVLDGATNNCFEIRYSSEDTQKLLPF